MNKVLSCILVIATFVCYEKNVYAQDSLVPASFFGKEEITVVITDSGLGGLSVMDDVARKLKISGCYKKVSLIFANALFNSNTGYNTLQTRAEKINQFSNVLTGIEQHFKPDVILIACNTLSVLYKETDFVKKSKTSIFGIVDSGVSLIMEQLSGDVASKVILFGTETTIEEGSHRKALLALHMADERIIAKSCPQLQSYIEQNPHGEETEMLISVYLNEALGQLSKTDEVVYLSLNCSHFGYSEDLWRKALAATPFKLGAILDPNYRMADILIDKKHLNKYAETTLSFLVVSKVDLLNEKAMFQIFKEKSPELAKALQNYRMMPDLF